MLFPFVFIFPLFSSTSRTSTYYMRGCVAPDQRHFRVDDLATTVKYNHSILDLSYINIITLHLISTTNSALPLYQSNR